MSHFLFLEDIYIMHVNFAVGECWYLGQEKIEKRDWPAGAWGREKVGASKGIDPPAFNWT